MFLTVESTPLVDQPMRCINEMKRKGLSGDAPVPPFQNSIVVGKNVLGRNLLKLIVRRQGASAPRC
jgi:hypothetical protein